MAIERVFLGWDGPALPRAVAVYRRRWVATGGAAAAGGEPDAIVAVPTRSASRRFVERLVDAEGGAATPPTTVTPGGLPELLYAPPRPVADAVTARWVRAAAMRDVLHEANRVGGGAARGVAALIPRPPASDDAAAWWRLAEPFERLAAELAAAGLGLAEAADRVARLGVDDAVAARWAALAALEGAYRAALDRRGRIDREAARLDAASAGRCRLDRPIVLVGLDDLPPLAAAMLRRVEGPVVALIHAPEEQADAFDELGVLRPKAWRDRDPGLDRNAVRFVDEPADQALAAAEAIQAAAIRAAADRIGDAKTAPLTPSGVTLGMLDPSLAGPVRRTLADAGVTSREPRGRSMSASPPAALLRVLAEYAATRRLDALAALLRHADADRWLRREAGGGRPGPYSPLTDLDAYLTDHLQRDADRGWLGEGRRRDRLAATRRAVDALLPDGHAAPRPLPAWGEAIRGLLLRVYGDRGFVPHRPADDAAARPLQALGEAIDEHARLDPADDATPRVDFAAALRLAAERLVDRHVPEPAGTDAVELLGPLELPLDDAPVKVLVGANDGRWPEPPASLPWLPESLRGPLGLVDRDRRLARERYRLIAMRHACRELVVVAGRWSARGDPLAPSRVLISGHDAQAAGVVRRFYRAGAAGEPGSSRFHVERGGGREGFLIPAPVGHEPVTRLAVTAFRDYLACPYRFYLRHVLKLRGLDDAAVELTPLAFGSLTHDTLQRFAQDRDAARSDDPVVIEACLRDALATLFRERHGASPRPAVRLQRLALEERLAAFAFRQAELTREGWLIDGERVERDFEHTLAVEGKPFTLTGRIDRVDRHAETGGVRLIDYKTGDTATTPERAHRRRGAWVDLQLPIYRDLAGPLGLTAGGAAAAVEAGYFNLPRKPADAALSLATRWTDADYDDARETRDAVIRAVRDDGRFWPPSEPPTRPDEFARVCGDAVRDRPGLVAASAAGGRGDA